MTKFVSWIGDAELITILLKNNTDGEHDRTILRLLKECMGDDRNRLS